MRAGTDGIFLWQGSNCGKLISHPGGAFSEKKGWLCRDFAVFMYCSTNVVTYAYCKTKINVVCIRPS